MKVFIAGGTGFVGTNLVTLLREKGIKTACLTRGPLPAELEMIRATPVRGDITDLESLKRGMDGCDAAINLVGIIKEIPSRGITFERMHGVGAETFARAAVAAGIPKIIHMSALGTRPDAASQYHRTKLIGEHAVIASGLPYTIFRPSLQLGYGGDFTNMMFRLVAQAPIVPVFGDGSYLMQPMDVADTCQCFLRAISTDASNCKTYEIGGPEQLTYLELIGLFEKSIAKRKLKLSIPLPLARAMVASTSFLPHAPITRDQFTMLLEDNTCDNSQAAADLSMHFSYIAPLLSEIAASLMSHDTNLKIGFL